jgi:NRPS condensation-like uncharacterized protein
MPKQKIDVMRLWFLALEELGDFIGMRFGRMAPGASEPEWVFPRHADYDGVGWFAENLRRNGVALDRLPTIRHPAVPSRLAVLRNVPKYFKPRHRLKWGPIERGDAPGDSSKPPRAMAWHLFDEDATTQIRRVCRNVEVTVNSFLLKHLTKAIRPSLEDQSAAVPWMIPINMRGKVKEGRDTANYTSYARVKVQSYETVHDIHQNIYAALCHGEHWTNWQAYQLGRFLTAGMRRYLVATELAIPEWNFGAFSNMGVWDPDKEITRPECLGGWFVCPPVLRCQLVGVGVITFQNRLSLTIQIHPDVTTDAKVPQIWIRDWVREIEMDVASILKPAAGDSVWA